MIATLLTIVLLTVLGWTLSSWAGSLRTDERLGVSFLTGAGAVTLILLLFSLAGLPWSLPALAIVSAALGWLVWFFSRRRPGAGAMNLDADEPSRIRRLSVAVNLAIAFTILAYASYATLESMNEWDYLAIWGQKARVFYLSRGVDFQYLLDPERSVPARDYPPLAPIVLALPSLMRGEWNDSSAGLMYVGFASALILIVRGSFRRDGLSPLLASLGTLAVASAAMSPWIGLAEGFLLAFIGGGLLLIRRGVLTDQRSLIGTGAFFLGCAGLSKNEGMAAIIATAIGIFAHDPRRAMRRLFALWPAIAVVAPWMAVRTTYGLQTDFTTGSVLDRVRAHLAEASDIVGWMIRYHPEHGWYWIGVFAAILFALPMAFRKERFLLFALAAQVFCYVAQNFATLWTVQHHIMYSFHRLMYQVGTPLGYLAVVLLLRIIAMGWESQGRTSKLSS